MSGGFCFYGSLIDIKNVIIVKAAGAAFR